MIKKSALAALAAISLALMPGLGATETKRAAPEQPSEAWAELREALFENRAIAAGDAVISLDLPYRAHDPAAVPVGLRVDPGPGRAVKALTLIVDENPVPVAAEFSFHAGMGHEVALGTRIRVNAYSNVRAVVELDDGSLHQSARFVKATGGCGAPATKDPAVAAAQLGRMKIRHFEPAVGAIDPERREAQVMIRHPNSSGFQIDQVTQLYIPAHFVDTIVVAEGGQPLFEMAGGISLSEDPSIRFEYQTNGSGLLTVAVTDSDGGTFAKKFSPPSGS